MPTRKEDLVDVTPHLKLLYQDAGLVFPEGETWQVPRRKWEKWKKKLFIVEVSNDDPCNSQDKTS